jgi:hypothetical protein
MKHINFGSIGDIKQCAKSLVQQADYIGDQLKLMSVVLTEKVHGTNAGFSVDNKGNYWVNSRERILSLEKDNQGCCAFVHANIKEFLYLANKCIAKAPEGWEVVTVPFEFGGDGIQKKSALSGIGKKVAVIFPYFKATIGDEGIWREMPYFMNTNVLINIMGTPGCQKILAIDFKNVNASVNDLLKIVNTWETQSPLANYFSKPDNIGEGLVGHFFYMENLFRFKVKGTKHANSKVKVLQPVDDVKEQAKINFINFALPAWRLEQMAEGCYGPEDTGRFMKALHADVLKECSDELVEAELSWKDVVQKLSKQAREWYNEYI